MAFRLYIVPAIGDGFVTMRGPKYFLDGRVTPLQWSAVDYGNEPWEVVGADCSAADDAFLAGQPDVTTLPFDLSPQLTAANVTTVQNKLEAANIPAGWVNTTLTWREVVRTVLGMFSYLQRYAGVYGQTTGTSAPSLFGSGVTLATTFGALPAAVQSAMVAAAQSFNIPTTGLTASTTLRAILKNLADFFQDQPYYFGVVAV